MPRSKSSTPYGGAGSPSSSSGFPSSLESSSQLAASPELAAAGPSAATTTRGSKRSTGKAASHSRRKGPSHIPRPRNAFILFRCHAVANNLVPEELERDHRNISRIISHMWNSLSPEDRKTWQLEAQKEKEEHQRLYPNYKYQPVYRKPVTKHRNVARPDDVQEKCEQAADLIMKMYGDKGIVKDENGVTMSQSARKKAERREAWKLKCSLPRASRATSSKASGSPSKIKKESPSSSTSSLPRLTIDEPVNYSQAGDLATSVHPSFAPDVFLDPGHHADGLQRRSTSVPPLDDASGESMTQAMLNNVSIEPVSLHRYPNSSFGRQLDNRNTRTAASQSLFADWEARLHQASSSRSEGALSPTSSGGHSQFENQPIPPRTRKGPPPPLLGHPHLRPIIADSFGNAVSPLSDVRPNIDPGTARPKTMESATPRTTSFSVAPAPPPSRAMRDRLGHPTGDVMLVSPMQLNFEAPRRASAAWQSWSRMSNSGLLNPDPLNRRTSHLNPAHPSSQMMMPYGTSSNLMSPTFNVPTSRASGSDVLLEHANGDPVSQYQPLGVGLRSNSEDDVFHFSPDFLESRSELGGSLGGSRGRSVTESSGVMPRPPSMDQQAQLLAHEPSANGLAVHPSGMSPSMASSMASSMTSSMTSAEGGSDVSSPSLVSSRSGGPSCYALSTCTDHRRFLTRTGIHPHPQQGSLWLTPRLHAQPKRDIGTLSGCALPERLGVLLRGAHAHVCRSVRLLARARKLAARCSIPGRRRTLCQPFCVRERWRQPPGTSCQRRGHAGHKHASLATARSLAGRHGRKSKRHCWGPYAALSPHSEL